MKKQVKMIIIVILILLIAAFALLNVDSVAVNFGFGKLQLPMIIMLILWVLVGALISFLFTTTKTFVDHHENKQLTRDYTKQIEQLNAQIATLKKQAKATAQPNATKTPKD